MNGITVHCLVKNEENFVGYAIKSVVNFVDQIFIFDTGSTDKTVEVVRKIAQDYPSKILFEEKGACDKAMHTQLRQEMVERTKTHWFMILDGDEVWPKRAMEEALEIIKNKPKIDCIMAPFYLCVGDIYHRTYKKGSIELLGQKDFFYPRFIKVKDGVHWSGDYNEDTLLNKDGLVFFQKNNSFVLEFRYWHMTHLRRSSFDDNDYSSGGSRCSKRRLTYFIIGKDINEPIPEVLWGKNNFRMNALVSFINFIKLIFSSIIYRV